MFLYLHRIFVLQLDSFGLYILTFTIPGQLYYMIYSFQLVETVFSPITKETRLSLNFPCVFFKHPTTVIDGELEP